MLNDLVSYYSKLVQDCPIKTLGEQFAYYYADQSDNSILARNIIEIDIESAFPIILQLMFGRDHQFVKNFKQINNKEKRLIYISTTLTAQKEIDGRMYLSELNNWSKIIVLGFIYNNYSDVSILQYEKDGASFSGNIRSEPVEQQFNNILTNNGINFHIDNIGIYIRFNRTSFAVKNDEIKIKGRMKDPPGYIKNTILPLLLLKNDIYNFKILNNLKKIYSDLHFQIVLQSHISDKVKEYYTFGKNSYLNSDAKIQNSLVNCDPKQILLGLIYPILALLRLEK